MRNNNIVQMQIHIRGVRALLQHKFGPDALPLIPQERTGVAGNDPEEWRRTCMVNRQGQLYVTGPYLFAAIREGGRYLKKGRGTLMATIAATLLVLDDPILITNRYWPGYEGGGSVPFDVTTVDPPPDDPDMPVYLDIRGVKNPSSRGRNIRYRVACAVGWEMQFTIEFDKTIIAREQMESAIWHTGKLVGVGNGRNIGFGRFELLSFTEKPLEESTQSVTAVVDN